MDVYLVPLSADRHELYCEVPDDPVEPGVEPPSGWLRRMVHRFRQMLADAERERREGHAAAPPDGWLSRVKARSMRWVAESIAQQRLLWHLRRQTEARLYYPDDLDDSRAMGLLRSRLRREFEKHRFWLIVDTLGFIASGLLVLVPGPNLVAYYFAFRLVGHYLSLSGARQGLTVVHWHVEKSAPLSDLRRAMSLDTEARVKRVHDVATQLHLEHLPSFFERAAVPSP